MYIRGPPNFYNSSICIERFTFETEFDSCNSQEELKKMKSLHGTFCFSRSRVGRDSVHMANSSTHQFTVHGARRTDVY
jgi:hypothetical protein